MAAIQCKICGGMMELTGGKTLGDCPFCGSQVTLPAVSGEDRTAAFNRGNHFRRIGEFDKALAVYERLMEDDETNAEAHWCSALCRFGVEYVQDPATGQYLPTCHRASYDSFLEDVDTLAAIRHADPAARARYQQEAEKIAEVQRGILAVSQREAPFDVFLCYKETGADGQRTHDSALAQDVYYQLTDQGLRVFFARITLEDKPGTAYEPYIFAALNTAKVMVVIGTRPENLSAPWVRNEWSRFLALMKRDRTRLLIPCYRDMDPYDMPEQLSVLQGYDMSRIGFIQDLVRGIRKVVGEEKPAAAAPQPAAAPTAAPAAPATEPLLRRIALFLEDGDWKSADEYCERVLDIDPENARAYVGKLMAALQVTRQEKLKDQAQPFDGNPNYAKALRFADDTLAAELRGAIAYIKERNERAVKDAAYQKAEQLLADAQTEQDFINARRMFEKLSGYRDADVKAAACQQAICDIMEREAAERAVRQRQEEAARRAAQEAARRRKRSFGIGTAVVALLMAVVLLVTQVIIPNGKYSDAVQLMESGRYEEAIPIFEELGGFKDSADRIADCKLGIRYEDAMVLMAGGHYSAAYSQLSEIRGYRDVDELLATDANLVAVREAKFTVGNYVTFGSYPQTKNGTDDTPIEWLVLARVGDHALIISRYALDAQPYNTTYGDHTWENCSLRIWLNETFRERAFNAAERNAILRVEVTAHENKDYSTSPGNATVDWIFLLSTAEAADYFASDEARKCLPTEYAVARGAFVATAVSMRDNTWWGLRTPGQYASQHSGVGASGIISYAGNAVNTAEAVRPALWVDIHSGIF